MKGNDDSWKNQFLLIKSLKTKKAYIFCNSLENSLYSVVVFDHVLTHIDQIKVLQWLIVFVLFITLCLNT